TTKLANVASVRAATTRAAANRTPPHTMNATCRLVQSARKPPAGTESIVSHITTLTADPAAATLQPRSVSMVGPNPKTMANATLKSDQIRPATSTAASGRPVGTAPARIDHAAAGGER